MAMASEATLRIAFSFLFVIGRRRDRLEGVDIANLSGDV